MRGETKMRKTIAVCLGVGVFLSEFGCGGTPFEAAAQDAGAADPTMNVEYPPAQRKPIGASDELDAGKDGASRKFGVVGNPVEREPGFSVADAGRDADSDIDDTEPLPNAIMIATCETEPDELAVPLNALDDRYCDTVQAKAYRLDEEGSYEVSATYDWFIADTTVAVILSLPGKEHSGVQRPSVMYDVFWSEDPDVEPETTVTVCAQPKTGWPDQQPELCRTLPLRAVVNLDAAWCFSGATFESECDAWLVVQDGRYLTVDGDGVGSVYGRYVHFYKGEFYYEATLANNGFMSGTVTRTDTDPHELIGTWQAERMSP